MNFLLWKCDPFQIPVGNSSYVVQLVVYKRQKGGVTYVSAANDPQIKIKNDKKKLYLKVLNALKNTFEMIISLLFLKVPEK